MRNLKRTLLALAVFIMIAMLGFVGWAETPLGPEPEALAALRSDEDVIVTKGGLIAFAPARQRPRMWISPPAIAASGETVSIWGRPLVSLRIAIVNKD